MKAIPIVLLVLVLGGAGTAGANCATAANLVTNCNFQTDLSDWTQPRGVWSHSIQGSSQPGSAEGASTTAGASEETQLRQVCIDVSPGVTYGAGFDVQLVSGVAPNCLLQVLEWASNDCLSGAGSTITVASGPPGGTFTQISADYTSGASTEGVRLNLRCLGAGTDGVFTVRYDDVFLGVGLVPVELLAFGIE